MKKVLMVAALSVLASVATLGSARATTVSVNAAANSSGGGTGLATGITLTAGQNFKISAGANDTWSLGAEEPPCTRTSNAAGITTCYPKYSQSNLTAFYGSLVGQIDGGDFFLIGLGGVFKALIGGQLYLYNWDENVGDNSGSIEVKASVIPVPAALPLLLTALGGLGLLCFRQRRSASN